MNFKKALLLTLSEIKPVLPIWIAAILLIDKRNFFIQEISAD